ncbi:TadE family type IV pilus minor pilin [Cellulomonas sp. KRMCY2]|uniref:TadE family type IV pilus minor pilin n=1 Tax=Cellulomonas sp. KRMCY2 TaxID=1304865 RepID=UPI00045E865E|nr:TadE family type IV pilus minor pilin [Cellulomonas sp. KRMCY2]
MTVELALALPAVVLVVAVLLVTATATAVQLRCADGARTGARVAALGQSDAEVADVVRRIAGGASRVEVVRDPPWVEVRVSAAVPASWLTTADLGLTAHSTAWLEP